METDVIQKRFDEIMQSDLRPYVYSYTICETEYKGDKTFKIEVILRTKKQSIKTIEAYIPDEDYNALDFLINRIKGEFK